MQRYFSDKLDNNIFTLKDDDIYHIKTVMRMKNEDKIQVVYHNEPYLCTINNIEKNIQIKIKEKLEIKKDNIPKISLIVPLLKETKFDFILQKSTELGVNEIIPIILSRSIIKIDKEKENKKIDRWQKIVKEASEQSYRNVIPNMTNIKTIEDLTSLQGLNIVCSTEEENKTIKNILKNNKICDKINVLVGPEGGITNVEEEKLKQMGFIPVTLGSRIMRVETVPIYILSIINYESME